MQSIFIGLRSLEKVFFFPFLTTLFIEITQSQSDSILLFLTLTLWSLFSASLTASFVLWWNALIFLTFLSWVKDNWSYFVTVLFYSLVPQWEVWEFPWSICIHCNLRNHDLQEQLEREGPTVDTQQFCCRQTSVTVRVMCFLDEDRWSENLIPVKVWHDMSHFLVTIT